MKNESPENGFQSESLDNNFDEKDCISMADVAKQIGLQSQYVSYYLEGVGDKPNLGQELGIRYIPDAGGGYHGIKIHKDDVERFVERVRELRK
jgi:hypothetical protein